MARPQLVLSPAPVETPAALPSQDQIADDFGIARSICQRDAEVVGRGRRIGVDAS